VTKDKKECGVKGLQIHTFSYSWQISSDQRHKRVWYEKIAISYIFHIHDKFLTWVQRTPCRFDNVAHFCKQRIVTHRINTTVALTTMNTWTKTFVTSNKFTTIHTLSLVFNSLIGFSSLNMNKCYNPIPILRQLYEGKEQQLFDWKMNWHTQIFHYATCLQHNSTNK
jgi:hypothetical protein